MTYFKPWRRKFGIVVLLLTCVLAAGWIRSLRVCDRVTLRLLVHTEGSEDFVSAIYLETIPNYLLLHRKFEGTGSKPASQWIKYLKIPAWTTTESQNPDSDLMLTPEQRWLFGIVGMDKAPSLGGPDGDMDWICGVPYWLFVVPLTFLSALLLFSKPRRRLASERDQQAVPTSCAQTK